MTKTYEELISELKEIIRKIEDNETGLDESIALYERGALIINQCEELLASAELKISMLGRD
ncbi:MAG TPA: exodeoxyribonuclease VII small subunit [Methanoregulaceae archaeon]|nr:MAG: exodeoxyribonuclease VII small subunit [Methanolinea sp.]HON81917.1 exodeoxyribonuclease VII small subunit [Methanoregulaceae archaeon]HPD10685.1 exodeoxyribonuclease VII small subunit [Methanoregulaceae archaeon]HRT15814.1 exodeoxyribonuclease VII small subunit [Methanoregulaceae archaeon]HRU31328.1 exodeoxyribonuclease VII small subunit [Methanoregulaceae archaeon]